MLGGAEGRELFKKTGRANLFTAFCGPDLDVARRRPPVHGDRPRAGRVRPHHRRGPGERHGRHSLPLPGHAVRRPELLRPAGIFLRGGRPVLQVAAGVAGGDRRGRVVEADRHGEPAVRRAAGQAGGGEGHQPLRRRDLEGANSAGGVRASLPPTTGCLSWRPVAGDNSAMHPADAQVSLSTPRSGGVIARRKPDSGTARSWPHPEPGPPGLRVAVHDRF